MATRQVFPFDSNSQPVKIDFRYSARGWQGSTGRERTLSAASNTGTHIQNTLIRANACIAEQSFRKRSETRSLPNQALVLRVRLPSA